MGKSQITQAAVATPVTHVTWKKVKTTRGSKEKMVKFTPREKARYATGQSNESPTRAGSSSIQEPNLVQGNDADLYCYMDDASPLRTSRIPKSQNSYLEEWLPYKSRYLSVLLDMEALPDVMACFVLKKWNGRFFEDFTLWLVGLVLHLGHAGAPCPAGEGSWEDAVSHVDEEWEDIKESQQPAHLNPPDDRNYLTVVDTGSVHFCNVQYCNCPGSEDSHLQLTMASLFPATTKAPRTAFTFQVLDDFIRDNVECGTSTMNYYSKLKRVTSSAFPHLVLGFHQQLPDPQAGELVLFFPACPQPGINFARTFVMDSNFKAKHMLPKNAAKEVWLMDGNGFMKSDCNNHWAVNQANAQRNKLELTRIGGCACVRHGCFVPHAMVDLQKGEQLQIQPSIGLWHVHGHQTECFARYAPNFILGAGQVDSEIMETLWSSLNIISPSAQGMATAHCQELLDFQMNDTSALKWKFKVAKQSLATIQDKFNELDSKLWVEQELVVQSCWWNTLQAMDIYEVQLEKAPTMKAIEIDLIHNNCSFSSSCGSATWIAHALKVEQAQIMDTRATEADWLLILHWQDWLQSQIDALVHGAAQFIRNDWQVNPRQRPRSIATFNRDSNNKADDPFLPGHSWSPGVQYFHDIGLISLVEQEIHLRQGQANDALHELHLALMDKAMIFYTDVWKGGNYKMTTQAWGQISNAEAMVQQHATIYRQCQKQLIALGAGEDILDKYQELNRADLTDSAMNDRMLELYQVNWLCTKVLWDCWEEELELFTLETGWTQKFFLHKEKFWSGQHMKVLAVGNTSFTCYMARQSQMYWDLARTLGCTSRYELEE
ncbi:hypothetical protein F5J12DRAFT_781725 [Pisolithus orientalis]|uniref:uncharacterized protein n=1 Tax=Pisolithus orientalis TaxID=936130 RepID=UPI002224D497|nr:uncharacterized protein F5J12DRAFT_781725 [Pisolithus orientalis]KAI6010723.1 hypothetical protein F5J12DRAFT_781725 [Pisolithus orientalis]